MIIIPKWWVFEAVHSNCVFSIQISVSRFFFQLRTTNVRKRILQAILWTILWTLKIVYQFNLDKKFAHLGPMHTRYFCTWYCDKKIILSHGCLKSKVSSKWKNKSRYINNTQIKVFLLKSLPWLVNKNLCLKVIFLSHIFLSQYHNRGYTH